LFCGLGGWSDGLVMEGFDVLGVEIEEKIAELYKHPCLIIDVRNLPGKMFRDFDLIVGYHHAETSRNYRIKDVHRGKTRKIRREG